MVWMVICGGLAILVQAGFALFDTGLCRAKNAAHVMSTSFLVFALSATGFFVSGFALMGGAAGNGPGNPGMATGAGLIGSSGFFLAGVGQNSLALSRFVCLLAFITIAAGIPTGALAERWNAKGAMLFSLLVGAIVFPVYGFWIWGNGWLAHLNWGHGVVDFAGAGAMHLQGGSIALVTAMLLGPRIGKFDPDGQPRAILGHHLPMVFMGTLILAAGWFGLTVATALSAPDGRVGIVAANAILAAVAGALGSAGYMALRFGKPDPSMMCNGMLAGLVAIAAPCAFVQPWAAFLIGLIAGLLVVLSIFFWENRGVDDPVGAISVHGISGFWGMLALGLFADGSYGNGYNGIASPVGGLFYGAGASQLLAQTIGAAVCVAWNVLIGGLLFWLVGRFIGGNRVPASVEIAGLDIPEVGAPGYPEFITSTSPEQIGSAELVAARGTVRQLAKAN